MFVCLNRFLIIISCDFLQVALNEIKFIFVWEGCIGFVQPVAVCNDERKDLDLHSAVHVFCNRWLRS